MSFLLFHGLPNEEVSSVVGLFLGTFETVDEAKTAWMQLNLATGEIIAFDGQKMEHVCSRPHWKRRNPPQMPVGYEVNDWGVSDQ